MARHHVPMTTSRFWVYLGHPDRAATGKYLFFGPDAKELVRLGRYLISSCGFKSAKVSRTATGSDHVLCAYWKDDSRKAELADMHRDWSLEEDYDIRYRYWKSNEDTRRGKYSKQFLAARDNAHAGEDAERQYDDERYLGLFDADEIPF